MNNQLYTNLAEPFPQEMEKVVVKSGVQLIYIPVSEVINRLNKFLGMENWSFEIISCGRDQADPDYILAHARITYTPEGGAPIVRDGFGGSKVKRSKQSSQIIDLGDDFKGAVSDALKKAAQTLGVGLYLSRSDDAMEAESFMDSAPALEPAPKASDNWDRFTAIAGSLNKVQKEELNQFWASHSGGKPKPKRETASAADIDALIEEATRLSLGGEYVNAG
jgi:recombination DNA repair RAD52 pathway protein